METEKITIAKGGTHTLFIPSRGSSGLQLIYDLADSTIAVVTRRENKETLQPGDTALACFEVTGSSTGTTTLTFSEKRAGMPGSPHLPVKSYLIMVE